MPKEKPVENATQEKKSQKEKHSWVELIDGRRVRFITRFKHYITGKMIYAKDYGHKAFMIPLG